VATPNSSAAADSLPSTSLRLRSLRLCSLRLCSGSSTGLRRSGPAGRQPSSSGRPIRDANTADRRFWRLERVAVVCFQRVAMLADSIVWRSDSLRLRSGRARDFRLEAGGWRGPEKRWRAARTHTGPSSDHLPTDQVVKEQRTLVKRAGRYAVANFAAPTSEPKLANWSAGIKRLLVLRYEDNKGLR
jgi:hypothetical protein